MTPEAPPTYTAVGTRRSPDDQRSPAELLRALREWVQSLPEGEPRPFAQLFDAEAVAGPLHLQAAVARAARSRARGRARLEDPGAEVALHLAGCDQLPDALSRVGVGPSTRELVLLLVPPTSPEGALRRLRLEPAPASFPRPPSERTLQRLGVDDRDRAGVPRDRWEALAIEAGARVELSRPAGARRSKA